ncbi:MAG TPA: hypothetical protein PK626_00460 [Bacteroidales bacterium]|nr:hypothetical protein [Bacteroidales bacterium]
MGLDIFYCILILSTLLITISTLFFLGYLDTHAHDIEWCGKLTQRLFVPKSYKIYKELMKTKDFLYCESREDIPKGYMGYVYIAEMNSIFYYDNFIYSGESIVDVRGGQYLIKDLLK